MYEWSRRGPPCPVAPRKTECDTGLCPHDANCLLAWRYLSDVNLPCVYILVMQSAWLQYFTQRCIVNTANIAAIPQVF